MECFAVLVIGAIMFFVFSRPGKLDAACPECLSILSPKMIRETCTTVCPSCQTQILPWEYRANFFNLIPVPSALETFLLVARHDAEETFGPDWIAVPQSALQVQRDRSIYCYVELYRYDLVPLGEAAPRMLSVMVMKKVEGTFDVYVLRIVC